MKEHTKKKTLAVSEETGKAIEILKAKRVIETGEKQDAESVIKYLLDQIKQVTK